MDTLREEVKEKDQRIVKTYNDYMKTYEDLLNLRNEKTSGTSKSSKKAKKEKKFAAELKRGDKVVTKSGMHGKVLELNDKDASCVIETMSGKIKFERSAISLEMSNKLNAPAVAKK